MVSARLASCRTYDRNLLLLLVHQANYVAYLGLEHLKMYQVGADVREKLFYEGLLEYSAIWIDGERWDGTSGVEFP